MSSAEVREEIIYALRQGTVPARGLELYATGLEPLVEQVKEDLLRVGAGAGRSKWLRGDYGAGKTFTARHLAAVARSLGFATAEVQVSTNDTPLHKLETIYRRLMERLQTPTEPPSAVQSLVDGWIYDIGDKVTRLRGLSETDPAFPDACEKQIEDELADISHVNPAFAAVLRTYHRARVDNDLALAQGLLGWLAGQPNTGRALKAEAGIRGEIDGQAALTFLGGLLRLLRQSGLKGLVLVLDEVETVQRINHTETRVRSLDCLRMLVDLLSENRLPGLYLIVTGTPAFFDGPKGVQELAPLRDRLRTLFDDSGYDNLDAAQIRLRPFDAARLRKVGAVVRELYPGKHPERLAAKVDDAFVDALIDKLTVGFGGRLEVVPRLFLRTLVDVLDRVNRYKDYEPRVQYKLEIVRADLRDEELEAFDRAQDAAAVVGEPPAPARPRRLEE